VIKDLNKSFNQFAIDIHGILIIAIVEVISKFLVLSLSVCRVAEIILIERMLEDILGLYDVYRCSSPHQILLQLINPHEPPINNNNNI
jgi:hypothetical protein